MTRLDRLTAIISGVITGVCILAFLFGFLTICFAVGKFVMWAWS